VLRRLQGSCCCLAQDSLKFGEELLNRIEIWAIRWKIAEGCAARFDDFPNTGDLVNADVVHDDNIASPERRGEDLFHIGQEACAVHRPVQ